MSDTVSPERRRYLDREYPQATSFVRERVLEIVAVAHGAVDELEAALIEPVPDEAASCSAPRTPARVASAPRDCLGSKWSDELPVGH